ncbi:Cytochrome c [Rubripirellula amarantea]|uniref:Cytochrome c n=1 Tax=Rubripirellula amarantea TaxID=2527999 RepID=A0A5C5WQH4_9BACT|nr:HEAT repeat domain-containing protein [Rubripirellula amarantea]TWT52797.1 Cytochrome c [Rubripirellula amarantea]
MEGYHPLFRIFGSSPARVCFFALGLAAICSSSQATWAAEAQWIWANGRTISQAAPEGETVYFRKLVNLRVAAEGRIEITADDEYELYVNERMIGRGKSSKEIQEYDVTDLLEVGRNVIAVKAINTRGKTAALAARVSVKPNGQEKWYTFSSDASWRTSTEDHPMWETVVFNDQLWGEASSFGKLGETAPWDQEETVVAETQSEQKERFQIQKGFGVQRVLDDEKVGSVLAMAFNEFGHLIVSQEGGPLLLVFDKDEDGVPEQVRTYCDKVTSCQGILALNGEVFVTGEGPEGSALYRLTDGDRNGTLEKVKAIVKFKGKPGEHGAHGLRLGPDGMIYVVLGSYVQADAESGPGETLKDYYEGDLLPRYEDPSGHGLGVKAPGGTVIRTNVDGSVVEKVAGGLRNAYDLVFHPGGGMFIHDADMEADVDTAWFRPTALFDVTEAGEFGWRPGWAKWPEYYFDRLPNLLDTGRGSPTGAVCYEHYMFPVRYHNSMFLADWSEGRILNVRLKRGGSGYVADSEVFLKGQPLNVTDLEVGPDGAMYFCTGGRGTAGGVYRVVYKGDIPDRMKNLGVGIAAAIRQPQLESAWARQEIASVKRDLGDKWGQLVAGVAYSNDNPSHYRTRAMDLMQLFGPVPSEDLILELSQAPSEAVRGRAARMMGLHPGDDTADRLVEMLADSDAAVRRAACEAMLRSNQIPKNADAVLPLLSEDDRTLAFVGRRVLERIPTPLWRGEVLATADTRMSVVGMLALINADPSEKTCLEVLTRASELMGDFLSDADFVDTLRLCQVALHRGKIDPAKVTRLRDIIAEEFPAGDHRMNHEVIRLCAYLQADSVAERALDYINDESNPSVDRTLVAMCLQFISHDWTAQQRFEILKYYENTANASTAGALSMYLMATTRDFAQSLSDEDVKAILEQGAVWRNAALAAIYKLPRPIDDTTADTLRSLDRQLVADPRAGDLQRRLRTGIIAMLATASDKKSGEYLRKLWRDEPERRSVIAMALAQKPDGENWDYLVRTLSVLDEDTSGEVIKALQGVPIATDDPMALRQLILLGLRSENEKGNFENVEKLLEHWTGMQRPEGVKKSMKPWQKWYAKTYPDRPAAELPKANDSRWDFDQLVTYLDSDNGKFGDPNHGKLVYTKAQCANCHRFQDDGQSIGPSLTSLAKRFSKREILESILYPAHVVSDQYASKKVLTLDGRVLMGMVSQRDAESIEIRDANNSVTIVNESEVDQILPSTSSIMPSGLLDDLSLEEISDLMSYMGVISPLEVASRPKR